jgi:aryl carrier-like protein
MPLTPNGKVNRRALPAPAETRSEASAPYAAPRTEVEQIIAAIWQEVLQAPAVGIHDNFFDLGGHSLLVARVQNRLRAALGRELAVVDLFKYPTVDALARFITHEEQGQPALAAVHARARQRQEANERRQTAQRSRRDGE